MPTSLRDARVVGVPLRAGDRHAGPGRRCGRGRASTSGSTRDRPTLFVSGGSQGARSINLAVAGAAKELTAAGIQVLHVIGARNEPVEVPTDLPVPYVIVPYLADMELGYAAADLMLVPGRRDDARRGDGGRAAGDLRAAAVRQRRAAAQRAARWWRPAAACWSTTPS